MWPDASMTILRFSPRLSVGRISRFLCAILMIFIILSLLSCGSISNRYLYFFLSPFPGHTATIDDSEFFWRKLPVNYPVVAMNTLPTGRPMLLPSVQAQARKDPAANDTVRVQRQEAVKKTFLRCWKAYQQRAWGSDELMPLSGRAKNTFGGWGATLVDSLDTLWIMDLRDEFEQAVSAAVNISFETSYMSTINVFESNIRHLGGFLSAFDLSGDRRLLSKAKEVGDMLYAAFDTPNRMPVIQWNIQDVARGVKQEAPPKVPLAEASSFALEFSRLSILTGDPKWFDAAQRITDAMRQQQINTQLPGMWPKYVNTKDMRFDQGSDFTLGALADSAYEYLPKVFALLGGLVLEYRSMYENAMTTAMRHNFYQPNIPGEKKLFVSGHVSVNTNDGQQDVVLDPTGEHLVCFAGGMMALGGKLFGLPEHVDVGEKLMDGCLWTYKAFRVGIMPESFHMLPCQNDSCEWDEQFWKRNVLRKHGFDSQDPAEAEAVISEKRLPKGFTDIEDRRYLLRPEAIESAFVLYRITGRGDLLEEAWAMFEAIERNTRTSFANGVLIDVTVTGRRPPQRDSMESFWLGETLKYFYLMFADPDYISLDEFVFNTEAHPFRRLKP